MKTLWKHSMMIAALSAMIATGCSKDDDDDGNGGNNLEATVESSTWTVAKVEMAGQDTTGDYTLSGEDDDPSGTWAFDIESQGHLSASVTAELDIDITGPDSTISTQATIPLAMNGEYSVSGNALTCDDEVSGHEITLAGNVESNSTVIFTLEDFTWASSEHSFETDVVFTLNRLQ